VDSQSENPMEAAELDALLRVEVPAEPPGFAVKWQTWRGQAMETQPRPMIRDTGTFLGPWRVFDLQYQSTDAVQIGGWFLRPAHGGFSRGFVVGHGYGGRVSPDVDFPLEDSAVLYFCARGISRSQDPRFPSEAARHVLHGIEDPERYILRGCVEDTWLAVGALLSLAPELAGRVGYCGTSFGGGVGAMALAFEDRVQRAHLNVPTFGNQPLRMALPSVGSAAAVRAHAERLPGIAEATLRWFDAAVAARQVRIPVHCACALVDPAVAPVGQFSVFNALGGPKRLFVLDAGHMEYPGQDRQQRLLAQELRVWFAPL